MELTARLERMLKAYTKHYDIEQGTALCAGFDAIAIFHVRDEHYIATKKHVLYATDQHEYVYFAVADTVDAACMQTWLDKALAAGQTLITPNKEHMSTYVTLMVLANVITPEAQTLLKKARFHKNYRLSLHGWMEYRTAALEASAMTLISNPAGKTALANLRANFKSEIE